MKELKSMVFFSIGSRLISRFGVIGEKEVVTIAALPKRGVTMFLIFITLRVD